MNEAALYALEHIEITAEIHDAIPDMEELVFKSFDRAVKESISDWFGENWQCAEDTYLFDGAIWLYYIKDTSDWDKVYLALAYGGNGRGQNIWTFLGKNSRSGGNDYSIWLDASGEAVSETQNEKIFKLRKIEKLLATGFNKRKYNKKFWLQKTISFDSEDILKGLKNDGWDSALTPLREAWQPLVDLDWDEISKIVNETQE